MDYPIPLQLKKGLFFLLLADNYLENVRDTIDALFNFEKRMQYTIDYANLNITETSRKYLKS